MSSKIVSNTIKDAVHKIKYDAKKNQRNFIETIELQINLTWTTGLTIWGRSFTGIVFVSKNFTEKRDFEEAKFRERLLKKLWQYR